MSEQLTLGSLFDGSGGFPLGGLISGMKPLWASEIEPFPIRVTTKRLPEVEHYGDVSRLNGAKVPPVDIITFGSPCQDMSVAGKRAGLEGSRSNLFFEAIRIVKEMREATNGKQPRFIVWENVPGAFSSNGGNDFRAVLQEIVGIKDGDAVIPGPPRKGNKSVWNDAGVIMGNGYSVAWRVLDAQFGASPSVAVVSTLSEILMANVPDKYFLSATACHGILRRCSERGKDLPELLKKALERQAAN